MPEGSEPLILLFPTETLEVIFGFYATIPLSRDERPTRLALSQVCRRWREISLNLPAAIDASNTILAKGILLRSGSAPIDIICEPDSGSLRLRGDALKPHANRIRSFDLSFRREFELGNLLYPIKADLPNVESLSLKNTLWRPTSESYILAQAPFSPKMRKLELHGVAVSWIRRLSNLTTLALRGMGRNYDLLSTDLQTLLRSSPRLQYLSLDSIRSTRDIANSSPVHLPYLRILSLEETESTIHEILSLISFPATTRVQLDYKQLFHLQPITRVEPGVTRLIAEDATVKLVRSIAREPTGSHYHFTEQTQPNGFLTRLGAHLDLSRFTLLELQHEVILPIPQYTLKEFVARFTGLTTLQITTYREDPQNVPSIAPWEPQRSTPGGAITVSPGRLPTQSIIPAPPEDKVVDTLVEIARARGQASQPLTLLDLKIPVSVRIVEELKGLIREVNVSNF